MWRGGRRHISDALRRVLSSCQFWLYQFPYVSIRVWYGTLAGPARAPHGSCRIWKTLKIPLRGPYNPHMGIVQGTSGVLRIIRPNHKCTAVWSRAGPVAWCDHENSTDVKFLRVLHSPLWARNHRGDKNRTGPVVGCDWGIRSNSSPPSAAYMSVNRISIMACCLFGTKPLTKSMLGYCQLHP